MKITDLALEYVVTIVIVPLLLPTMFSKREKIQLFLTNETDTEDRVVITSGPRPMAREETR